MMEDSGNKIYDLGCKFRSSKGVLWTDGAYFIFYYFSIAPEVHEPLAQNISSRTVLYYHRITAP